MSEPENLLCRITREISGRIDQFHSLTASAYAIRRCIHPANIARVTQQCDNRTSLYWVEPLSRAEWNHDPPALTSADYETIQMYDREYTRQFPGIEPEELSMVSELDGQKVTFSYHYHDRQ